MYVFVSVLVVMRCLMFYKEIGLLNDITVEECSALFEGVNAACNEHLTMLTDLDESADLVQLISDSEIASIMKVFEDHGNRLYHRWHEATLRDFGLEEFHDKFYRRFLPWNAGMDLEEFTVNYPRG